MANFDLSKLMEGKNPQAVMLAETRQLKSKWEKTGLLEGMKDRDQHSMAVLLENQAKQLLDEATQTGTSSGSEEWSGVALPLVRRIFGEIASKEFVSVQPMNLPSGLIFFLDFKYGSAQGAPGQFGGKSLFGGTNATGSASNFGRTDAAVNGLYGEGRYGYSVNDATASVSATGNAAAGANIVSSSVSTWAEIGFSAGAASASLSAFSLVKFAVSKSAIASTADVDAVRAFQLVGANITANHSEFNYYNSTNGMVYLYASVTAGTNAAAALSASAVQPSRSIVYSEVPVSYDRGDFEDSTANSAGNTTTALDIPEIDLELKSEAIVAKTRKLKAVWTPELAQDLNAYHSIDAEAELTSMLSDYISLEIDLEILDMLKSNALTTEYWSTTVGEEYVGGAWSNIGGSSNAYTKNAWFQTLGVKLNKVSNKIHQLTLRGGANFIVASPDVCTVLESIPGFVVNADKDAMQFAAGVTAVGSMSNRYTVYKNPYMTSNEILMGYRGNNFLETGAVYAPYVPLIMTPLVYDPQNFTPRRGVMTRYAKKMVRPEYYGKIYVKDLASI
jgi:hypothetical protein